MDSGPRANPRTEDELYGHWVEPPKPYVQQSHKMDDFLESLSTILGVGFGILTAFILPMLGYCHFYDSPFLGRYC